MHSSNAKGSSAMDVQLEPQSLLLSRIQYVINTESQFSFLYGEPGVGKSFITSMLVDSLTDTMVIELNCRKNVDLESFKQDLICQLATDDLSDINQSPGQSIQGAMNFFGLSVLIVIDNAHYLPQAFVGDLWHSFNEVLAASSVPRCNLNMLLVGNKKWARPIIGRLQESHPDLVTDFELNYLSASQGIDFLSSIHPDWSDQKIESYVAALNSKPLTPQRLIFTEQAVTERSERKWLIPVAVISLLLSVIATGWFLLSEAPAPETQQAIQLPPEIIVLSSETNDLLPEDKPASPETNALPAEDEAVSPETNALPSENEPVSPEMNALPVEDAPVSPETNALLAEDEPAPPETEALPPEATVVKDNKQQAVLTTSEAARGNTFAPSIVQQQSSTVTPALSAGQLVAESIENATETSNQTLKIDEDASVRESQHIEDNMTVYRFDEEILLNVDGSHLSLMLGGYSRQSVLEQTMAKLGDNTSLYAYKTIRNGKDWFVLLYGNFADNAAAQQTITNMPSNLAHFSPWIKPFRLIHADITAVAATMDNNN